jgi:hypothetical protein
MPPSPGSRRRRTTRGIWPCRVVSSRDRWRRRAMRRILDRRGYGLTLVGRKRATRATTFDHVDRNRFSSVPTRLRQEQGTPFSAIPALRLLSARLPDLDCHFASVVGLAFLTFLTRLTSDTSQPIFDPKNQRLTAPQIWLSACLWSTRGHEAMLNDSGPHER